MKTISNPLRVAALLLVPLLLPVGSVTAGTIFDNGAADGINGRASGPSVNSQAADDFSLQPGATTITDIHWTGLYVQDNPTPATDVFSISIFEDNGFGTAPQDNSNSPKHAVLGTVSRTPTTAVAGFSAYTYSVDIDPIPLTAGVTYWLSIVNDTTTNNAGFNWFWATSNANGGNAVARDLSPAGGAWTGFNQELAFSLTDDNVPSGGAPLPGSLLLMLPGLLLLRRYAIR